MATESPPAFGAWMASTREVAVAQGHDHEHDHGDDGSYARQVERDRAAKDSYFTSSPASPIAREARRNFSGLAYFPVDEGLRLERLRLEPYRGDQPVEFAIPTSDGQRRPARRAGTFTFEIGGTRCTLTTYVLEGSHAHALFVPFLDKTSGSATYGAGRYLDLDPEADGTYVLDFNRAYHPLCVYSEDYSCPLTPAENRLPVTIDAGERLAMRA